MPFMPEVPIRRFPSVWVSTLGHIHIYIDENQTPSIHHVWSGHLLMVPLWLHSYSSMASDSAGRSTSSGGSRGWLLEDPTSCNWTLCYAIQPGETQNWFLPFRVFELLSSSLCNIHNVSSDMSSGLLQMFLVELSCDHRTSNHVLYLIHGAACCDSVNHNRIQVLNIPVLLLACSRDWTCNLLMIVS